MILQAGIFYFAAVYGGIEESLRQNAADILSQRLINRNTELETLFNNSWSDLDACSLALDELYADYEQSLGAQPLARDQQAQIDFLRASQDQLIATLRNNRVNGVFLILNDQAERSDFTPGEQKYGLCIRDMDQESNYTGREDLQLERSPSSLVDGLGCALESWWEARYTFNTEQQGDYYYLPLNAAWEHPGADGDDLAYCSGAHHISGSDPAMVSYSIPLISADGYPYGVLGVELSTRYLASLLPHEELNETDKCCYILALRQPGSDDYAPIIATGALFNRCFDADSIISCGNRVDAGGFELIARNELKLYGDTATLRVYNNNNPFEEQELTLIALVENATLFGYISRIKLTLLIVSLGSLALGIGGLLLVSRRFAAPITALARRVRALDEHSDFELGRLGVTEIDQLVDSIEELNRNVNKTSARTEFFSRMSHDMRTPMNAIISFSSPELLDGATPAVKDDYLAKIHASGQFLLGLINEVLDMTKIESNKIDLHEQILPAHSLLDPTIPIIDKLAQKKGVLFRTELELDQELYVRADGQHLNQIALNLLSNAVKFTPAGGSVLLRAALLPEADDPTRVRCRIEVADTGAGISAEFMSRLYTPFEQEHSSQGGTGLGLSIAKKLTELMHGSIDCVSEPNCGATFTVTVPLLLSNDSADVPLFDSYAPADPYALSGKRILVCEDNDINTTIIRHLLQKFGLVVTTALNGQQGVDMFAVSAPGQFDAILMDIRMPVLDGLAATRAIRALPRPDAATIPIIAMTANAFAEDVQASHDAGMNEHLAKPIEPAKLFSTLSRFLLPPQ